MTGLQFDTAQVKEMYPTHVTNGILKIHSDQLRERLRDLGADSYDLILPETKTLPLVIQPEEELEGIVYGRYVLDETSGKHSVGRGMLVATDKRVLLIDHKPMFIKSSEIVYGVVSAIAYSKAGLAGTITLHTRLGNVNLRTFNQRCADGFMKAVEKHIFRKNPEDYMWRPVPI